MNFIKNEWTPSQTPKGLKRVALIIPCTKYKPYLTSREHKAINNSLFSNGWNTIGVSEAPPTLDKFIEEKFFRNKSSTGYFLEIGAYDGKTGSNCLYFEKSKQKDFKQKRKKFMKK